MTGFPWSLGLHKCFFGVVRNKLPELIKRRSKVQEKNISCVPTSNFDQSKTFSENYRPMRFWLWLLYKFTNNYCRLRQPCSLILCKHKRAWN